MQLSNIPGKLVLPWATSGNKNDIPVASQIGITAGAASLTDGFPPLTMTPVAAGGVPPSGLDMNGILYEMSNILRWANAGGGYAYDSTFANDSHVGGYPKGARVMRSDGAGYWFNTVDNNITDPEAAGAAAAGWVPDYQTGATSVAMSGSSVTLTPTQYGKPLIVITGALSANLNLIFPALAQGWTIINNTTGGYSITAKTAGGSGITLGTISQIVGDGTNIYAANPDSVQIVTNVATLRNITPNLSRRIQTKGYYTDGDGGGSQYFPKVGASPGTYVDNGGTVIVPNGGDGSTAWLLDLTNTITLLQFGVKFDGSDNYSKIANALAANIPLHFTEGVYTYSTTLQFNGSERQITCDDGAHLKYIGAANAVEFTGNNHVISLGQITAENGTQVVKYHDLIYSDISILVAGIASDSVFMHDGAAQTVASGNNKWTVGRIEAGSVPYGIKLNSSATYTLEGEVWDVKVLFSATNTGLKIGTAGNNKIRWNEFNVSIDSQGITPLLIDVYNDANFINLRTWQGNVGATHVRFETGTGSNILISQTGVQGPLNVVDNGTNVSLVPGNAGQMIFNGNFSLNLEAGSGTPKWQVGDSVNTGTDVGSIENKSSANATTKYVGFKWRGRDTINSGKDVAYARAIPLTSDWTASRLAFYTRNADVLSEALELREDLSANIKGDKAIISQSKTPASAGAAGETGSVCWDSSYIYVCVATNTWKRSALASW